MFAPTLTGSYSGSRLGEQISDALIHMPNLQELSLAFCPQLGVAAWTQIANGPSTTITTLKALSLNDWSINMCDFSKIILGFKCLTSLQLPNIHLYKGVRGDLAQIFFDLANGPCELEYLYFGRVLLDDYEEILFPTSLQKPYCLILDSEGEIEDDEDWVVVQVHQWMIHWKGKDDIKWVLRQMVAHARTL
jgi:hypothetical protein